MSWNPVDVAFSKEGQGRQVLPQVPLHAPPQLSGQLWHLA